MDNFFEEIQNIERSSPVSSIETSADHLKFVHVEIAKLSNPFGRPLERAQRDFVQIFAGIQSWWEVEDNHRFCPFLHGHNILGIETQRVVSSPTATDPTETITGTHVNNPSIIKWSVFVHWNLR